MISKVLVENYKALDSLEVDGLKKINVFVGKNNCGKSTLLEAIYLNCGAGDTGYIFAISNYLRHMMVTRNNLSLFFNKMDISKHIEVSATHDGEDKKVRIKPKFSMSIPNNNPQLESQRQELSSRNNVEPSGLELEAKSNDDLAEIFDFEVDNNGGILNNNSRSYKYFICTIIPSFSNIDFGGYIGNIRRLKKEKDLLRYLKIFDDNINGVEVIDGDIVVDIECLPQKVSAKVMGEGFRRYLFIVSSLIIQESKYLCIDEIENGLHFENINKLLLAIFELSEASDMQIFITTHSYEFLECLNSISVEKNTQDDIGVFNLSRTKQGKMKAYKVDDLQSAIETKLELRD